MANLVLSDSEEVHAHVYLCGVGPPVLVLVKVNVPTELPKLVRIISVGKDQTWTVERITKQIKIYIQSLVIQ